MAGERTHIQLAVDDNKIKYKVEYRLNHQTEKYYTIYVTYAKIINRKETDI